MDCKTANRLIVPFLEDELTLEETEGLLDHVRECYNCREDLEIYYTVRIGINGLDQDRFQTYDLRHKFEKDLKNTETAVKRSLFILRLRNFAVFCACVWAGIAGFIQLTRWL